MIAVSVDNRTDLDLPLEEYRQGALFVLGQRHLPENAELAVSLVGIEEITQLNRQYRGVDEATDVLSFECDAINLEEEVGAAELDADEVGAAEPDAKKPDTEETLLLGDVIIAPDIAKRHAEEFDSTFEEEMRLMLIHGILHILGYDHIDEGDYAVMYALENDLLAELNERSIS